ncbi:bifunctional diaminohydroxyphosphoribosylaminopyrimidine deaminase/5-amino-6-(5-phosphoribosylamino)uracil reductase RibD [Polyangium aurulentum]|uniref:bifunctional diaminohydroxyphosphoribosylaminopyrimidine deaminase/5-amino-6-(5-phosphoribosylamino)uracil reductase RibD n=1 Tax=Polyangium aurulentum TaxID=2567896 RepID=UPI0010AE58E9|nr:bifunctional diaminohydroxyphosphoribosylaminopyrimidine deaminase/5-amino-6-(5-phosphoribosylamino)uracil reductase RibD [Polyangium aurulentum]UQA63938.1 bifunctional diaminohydroxyphosphoribosylaminopyrimidine deaminase/5-amino-6-(5-phosphoribosylamino)uracil reductase RibD [Polyangium aurulentum]
MIVAEQLDSLALQALELAARGATEPNPMVGAIIVSPSGEILGRGWHHAAGKPHAEVEALQDAVAAGRDVRGATMVVTLEPCNHFGRTPPCTEAILAAGIAHVHVALRDPNPIAAGGMERLEAAGVRTSIAGEEVRAAAARQNEAFLRWVSRLDARPPAAEIRPRDESSAASARDHSVESRTLPRR